MENDFNKELEPYVNEATFYDIQEDGLDNIEESSIEIVQYDKFEDYKEAFKETK